MITFEVLDDMPSKSGEPPTHTVIIHGNGPYISGYVRCACGVESPVMLDPLGPFRWLARHTHE